LIKAAEIYRGADDPADAIRSYEDAAALYHQRKDAGSLASVLAKLAETQAADNKYADAEINYTEAIQLMAQRIGPDSGLVNPIRNKLGSSGECVS
jgi:hypothetical protein